MLPLRKSACPTYLSYEQTLHKLAEEAKFYRFTKLQRALPNAGSPSGNNIATLAAPPHHASQLAVQPRAMSTPLSSRMPLPPVALSPVPVAAPLPNHTPTPAIVPPPLPEATQYLTPASSGHRKSRSRTHSPAPSISSPRASSRAHSRRPSIAETEPEPAVPPQSLFAYIYRPGQFGIRRGEPEFKLIDYPDDIPIPHLFIRVVNAEIK